jgi:hypothetical protein
MRNRTDYEIIHFLTEKVYSTGQCWEMYLQVSQRKHLLRTGQFSKMFFSIARFISRSMVKLVSPISDNLGAKILPIFTCDCLLWASF